MTGALGKDYSVILRDNDGYIQHVQDLTLYMGLLKDYYEKGIIKFLKHPSSPNKALVRPYFLWAVGIGKFP